MVLKINSVVGFFAILLAAATARPATIAGRVLDGETGATIPATIRIRASDGAILTDHPSFQAGFRSEGTFEKEVPAGETTIVVSRGFDYLPVQRRLTLAGNERRAETFELRRRSPLRREGWYCGDNHDHMIHGERTILVSFPYVAMAARAEGLDYLAVAQDWNISKVSPEELERATRALSLPDFKLTWNLEAPKNYWRGDASHTLGHGWTVGMRGRTSDGRDAIAELLALSAMDYESEKPTVPNFEIQALIHSLGGITTYSHPARWWVGKWGGQGIYPVEDNKFISNMAAELPFDTVCGPTYDAVDILMPPQEVKANQEALKLWFLLLNHGYRIAAGGSSDATFDRPGGGVPGKVRMYTHLDGDVEMPLIAEAMKAGRSFVTSGPLLVLEIGGRTSGSMVTLPAPAQKGRIRAWADRLTRVDLIRNGVVVRTFDDAAGKSEFTADFDISETGPAWYIARCYGSDEMQVAFTNPVWFEPRGWQPPPLARARVRVSVVDGSGKALDGDCEIIRMVGQEPVVESRTRFRAGKLSLDAPGTARLRVRVPGYKTAMQSILMDYAPLRDMTLNMRPEQLSDWGAFERIRERLMQVSLEFHMER
jgi:TolB protein